MFSFTVNIDRSIIVAKPIGELFQLVADFNHWKFWSPWLCQEPDCPVKISGKGGQVGHALFWDGKRIGSSETKLVSTIAPSRLEYDFTFLKPWKAKSKVVFEFTTVSNGTQISWKMQATLPMLLLPMRDKVTSVLNSDFERGLNNLKELAETEASQITL